MLHCANVTDLGFQHKGMPMLSSIRDSVWVWKKGGNFLKKLWYCVGGSISLVLTERRPYWRVLARGRGSTDRAMRGPYKTTEGQYSPVWLELDMLVSSLLYATRAMLVLNLPAFENKKST